MSRTAPSSNLHARRGTWRTRLLTAALLLLTGTASAQLGPVQHDGYLEYQFRLNDGDDIPQFTTNVATVNTLMPILAGASLELGIDPRLLMIPAAVSASCAFMLPIGTPPNAIVFSSGLIPMGRMVRYGILLNVAGVAIVTVATFLLLVPQLGISLTDLPSWLER